MIEKKVICKECGFEFTVNSFRLVGRCSKCGKEYKFDGFTYKEMDMDDEFEYTAVEEADCPNCRSTQMLLDKKREYWRCVDCGFTFLEKNREKMMLWFCDHCQTFLNVQDGFKVENGVWKCDVCGFDNTLNEEEVK